MGSTDTIYIGVIGAGKCAKKLKEQACAVGKAIAELIVVPNQLGTFAVVVIHHFNFTGPPILTQILLVVMKTLPQWVFVISLLSCGVPAKNLVLNHLYDCTVIPETREARFPQRAQDLRRFIIFVRGLKSCVCSTHTWIARRGNRACGGVMLILIFKILKG